MSRTTEKGYPLGLVVVLAALVAVVSARPYAGSWNDGSRLAAVESLVDRGTLAIDGSMFVDPTQAVAGRPGPYPGDDPILARGTQDKLLIGGRYYSDKTPLPALWLAGVYWTLQRATGLVAREAPGPFVYTMTLAWSGMAYLLAVTGMFAMARRVGHPADRAALLAGALGLGTVALAYARHVNNHIALLAVVTWCFALAASPGEVSRRRAAGLGGLAGLGYVIDLGIAPVLTATSLAFVVARRPRLDGGLAWVLGWLPWVVAHHALNYQVTGTVGPANAVPAYLAWPGSPFTPDTMTGRWNHPHVGAFVLYAGDMLVGRRGFLLHNLPMLLAIAGAPALLRAWRPERAAVVAAVAFMAGSWLLYGALSVNLSGVCISVRWFVPLLAPAWFLIAVHLRERPDRWRLFGALSGWGVVVAGLAWWGGPWSGRMIPLYWLWVAAALATAFVVERGGLRPAQTRQVTRV